MATPRRAKVSRGSSNAQLGMVLMALTMLVVPCIDAMGKYLSATLAPGQITWGRFLFQTLVLAAIMLTTRRRLRSHQYNVHAARGLLLASAILLLFWALKYLPIANAIAIFFVEPLILTLLSVAFLGERIGPRRLAAVVVGLLGALIIIRPNWAAFGPAAVLPLGTAVCFAGYLALTRHAVAGEDPLAMQLWAGLFGALGLSVAIAVGAVTGASVLDPVWPRPSEWALLVALGTVAAVAHVVLAFAFRYAEAGLLAPFQYLEIISATILGYVVFDDFPDPITWLGTALIIAAGLYVFARERRLARLAAP